MSKYMTNMELHAGIRAELYLKHKPGNFHYDRENLDHLKAEVLKRGRELQEQFDAWCDECESFESYVNLCDESLSVCSHYSSSALFLESEYRPFFHLFNLNVIERL